MITMMLTLSFDDAALISHTLDRICTPNVSVPACSSSASSCKIIGKNNVLIKRFISLHPEVYADECLDTSGALCFYTDVKYHKTCSTASTSKLT